MTLEEALDIAQTVLDRGRLSKVQELVFRKSWEKLSYQEIAKSSSYELGYIRDVGYKLWQSLSETLGTKVTKSNFHSVLEQQYVASLQRAIHKSLAAENEHSLYQDWGEAIDTSVFYGRTAELGTLNQWLVEENCRLIVLLGMAGIGKTSLATKLVQDIQHEFKCLVWRSLRSAPPIKDFLTDLILFLSRSQEVHLPETVDGQISLLIKCLRSSRCLLIIDNAESLLRSGELAGCYLPGYEGYGQLMQRVADEHHSSCLLIISREKPIGLASKEGRTLPIRSFHLNSLQPIEAQEVLKGTGLNTAEDESRQLIECYTGNPLFLKIAATIIQSLFDGDVSRFLAYGKVVFGDIWELLDQHFNRLSDVEKQVMYCLTTTQGSMTLVELLDKVIPSVSHRKILEALESLKQRSLLQGHSDGFVQQLMIKEYVTERLDSKELLNGKRLAVR